MLVNDGIGAPSEIWFVFQEHINEKYLAARRTAAASATNSRASGVHSFILPGSCLGSFFVKEGWMTTVSADAAPDFLAAPLGLMFPREAPVTESVIQDPLGFLIKALRTESNAFF